MRAALIRWALLAAVSCIAVGGVYLKGRIDGRAAVMDKLAADRVTILQDGKVMDHEVFSTDDAGLCAFLGGC